MSVFSAVYTDSGLPVEGLTGANCGERLLGVPKSVYQRSAFVRQAGLGLTPDESLESRLSALVTTGDETVSYAAADKRLQAWQNRVKHNKTGLIPDAERALAAVEENLQTLAGEHQKNLELHAQLQQLQLQKTNCEAQLRALEARRDAIQKEYDALADGRAKYNMANALQSAKKQARDAFLDIVNLVGGFMMLDDLTPVTAVFMNLYKLSKLMCKAEEKRDDRKLTYDDAKFAYEDAVSEGRNARSLKAKADKARALLDAEEDRIAQLHTQLESARAQIEEMRKPYKDNEEFQRLEGFRDDGIDLARLKYNEIRKLRSDLQMIFQDPYSSLNPRMSVGQIISEGMQAHNMIKKKDARMQQLVLNIMDECGLAPYFLHRFPHQFSGGQRQRIGIARSLAVHPKFVVCDEAVSALDVSIQSQIINLLKDLKEQQNLTYMFITHDLSVVKYISDRIGVMYLGNMVELANTQELFDHPLHPYTEALMAAIPTTDVEENRELRILEGDIPSPVNPPQGCKFHTRCAHCTEICKHAVPEWKEMAPGHFVACHHPLSEKE